MLKIYLDHKTTPAQIKRVKKELARLAEQDPMFGNRPYKIETSADYTWLEGADDLPFITGMHHARFRRHKREHVARENTGET